MAGSSFTGPLKIKKSDGSKVTFVDEDGSLVGDIQDTLAQGSIYIGNASGVTSELDASGDAEFLIGDGTTAAMQSISGDITIDNAGNATVVNHPVRTSDVFISAAEIKALRATPIELIAAQGGGRGILLLGATLELRAGSEVLTEGGDNLAIKWKDSSGTAVSETIETTNFIDQAANTITTAVPVEDAITASGDVDNQPLVLHNTGGSEIAGNASNDAELRVRIVYRRFQV